MTTRHAALDERSAASPLLGLAKVGALEGAAVSLLPLTPRHVPDLWAAARDAGETWRFLGYGPFESRRSLEIHLADLARRNDQPFFAVVPSVSRRPEGWLSYCDAAVDHGSIEIGSIWFSPRLQRTRAGTEAIYLMLDRAFALGFHRVAWRCDALNGASMRAALRLGFSFEGVWRGAHVVKGRRRDTAWFSLLAPEWPDRRDRIDDWLSGKNFTADGVARRPLR